MATTREGTQVYFSLPSDYEEVSFEERAIKALKSLEIEPFHSERNRDPALIWKILEELIKRLKKLKDEAAFKRKEKPVKVPVTRADKINKARLRIAAYLERQTRLNFKDACRHTGYSFAMVKKVHRDMLFQGQPQYFTYPNLKPPHELEAIDQTVRKVEGTYSTITDIKRVLPGFSKRWISRKLRSTGLRWRKMVRKRKKEKKEQPEPTAVFEVVSHIVQALNNPNVDMYYCDEMHFPLFQTADNHWTKPGKSAEMVYNRRAVPLPDHKLSAIAMCSLDSFCAVQIYKKDVTAEDFLFFMQEALKKMPQGRQVTVLADNATWHTSPKVVDTVAGKFIHFNVSRLFQSNAIETSFSFVRADFRKRPTVEKLEDEASLVLSAFFDPRNIERFRGVERNHLRSLKKLLEWASPNLNRQDLF